MTAQLTAADWAILIAAFLGIGVVMAYAIRMFFQAGDDGHVWAAPEPVPVELPALTATVRTRGPMSGGDEWLSGDDDDVAEWLHQLVGPARVMAVPVPAAVEAGITALVLAARQAPAPPNVSGPAVVPDPPAAEPSSPQGGAAGPETHLNPAQLLDARHDSPDPTGHLVNWRTLPPVDEAAHLQPIDWADTTGSFAAIFEAGQ